MALWHIADGSPEETSSVRGTAYSQSPAPGGAWGYITDPSGMLQLGARYYWPEVGRFISQDPIGEGGNWYAYVGSRPVVSIDPEGTVAEPCPAAKEKDRPCKANVECKKRCKEDYSASEAAADNVYNIMLVYCLTLKEPKALVACAGAALAVRGAQNLEHRATRRRCKKRCDEDHPCPPNKGK